MFYCCFQNICAVAQINVINDEKNNEWKSDDAVETTAGDENESAGVSGKEMVVTGS